MVTDADAIEILLQARGQEEVDAEARKTVQTWTDAFDLIKKAYPDPADMITNFKTMQDALSDIPGPDWSSLFDGLQESFTDATGTVDLAGWWNGIIEAMFASGIDVTQFVNDFASQIQDGLGDTIDVDFDVKLNTHDILDSINQIQQAIQEIAGLGKFSFDFNKVFDPDAVYELEAAIAQLTDQEVRKLYDALDRVYHTIEHLNINDTIKSDTLDQLQEYLDYIQKINEAHKETSGEGGNKLEEFLGRYKYALLLIGGAIGAIAGAIKYSSVFGTMMDVVGKAVGGLADVILMPLLPVIEYMVELIMVATEQFENLPDPIKAVISMLVGLGAVLLAIRAITGLNLFAGILQGLKWLLTTLATAIPLVTAAGALTGAGFIAGLLGGILLGMAGVYLLGQLGVLNWLAGMGDQARQSQPVVAGIWATLLAPIASLGVIVNDIVFGQFDQIPKHLQMVWEQAGNGIRLFAATVAKSFLDIRNSLSGFMGDIGAIMQKVPGLSLIGDYLVANSKAIDDSYDASSKAIDDYIQKIEDRDRALGLMAQYGGTFGKDNEIFLPFGRSEDNTAFNIPFEHGMEVPKDQGNYTETGSILNGLTYADQQKALLQQQQSSIPNIMKNIDQSALLSGTNIDYSGLDINYTKLMQIKDAYTQLEDAQDTYNDALHGGNTYSDSTIKQLEENVQKAQDNIFNLTDSLYAVGDASSKAIQQTGDAVQKVSEATQKTYTLVTKEYYQPSVLLSSLPKEQQDKLTGMTEQKAIQKVVIEPQYSVMEKAMPDVLPKITEQTVIQPVSVVPDYTLQDKTPFNITDALNLKEQDVIQQISITPDYTVQDIPLPKVSPDITDQVITQPVTITPDYTVQDILIPDISASVTLPDQELYQQITITPNYNLQDVPIPDITSVSLPEELSLPVTVTPDYRINQSNLPKITVPDQEISQIIGIVPEYSLASTDIPDLIPIMPDVTRQQKVTIVPEYLPETPDQQVLTVPVSLTPQYQVLPGVVPDIPVPDAKDITQAIRITPDYILAQVPIPDPAATITEQNIIQPVIITPEYTITDIAFPNIMPDITAQSLTMPVSVVPDYHVIPGEIPNVTNPVDVTNQVITQPVTITPNYSVTKTEIPQVMDTITPEIQKIAIPVTIEPVINLIDTLTGSASMITQAFVQSALNIESSFGAMIETVKSKVEMLSESIKTAVSTDNSQIPISQSMPAGGQAQPAITNHNTYQNYFTVQGTTDVRKLAEEVARILDRGANSHRI